MSRLTKLERTVVIVSLRQYIERASKRQPTWAYLAAIRALAKFTGEKKVQA